MDYLFCSKRVKRTVCTANFSSHMPIPLDLSRLVGGVFQTSRRTRGPPTCESECINRFVSNATAAMFLISAINGSIRHVCVSYGSGLPLMEGPREISDWRRVISGNLELRETSGRLIRIFAF